MEACTIQKKDGELSMAIKDSLDKDILRELNDLYNRYTLPYEDIAPAYESIWKKVSVVVLNTLKLAI